MVHDCYIVENYMKAYGYTLSLLETLNTGRCNQDTRYFHQCSLNNWAGQRKTGKTPKEKIKHGVRYLNKKGVTMHCSICGRADHNRNVHYRWREALVEEGVELVDENYDDPTFLQVCFTLQPLT